MIEADFCKLRELRHLMKPAFEKTTSLRNKKFNLFRKVINTGKNFQLAWNSLDRNRLLKTKKEFEQLLKIPLPIILDFSLTTIYYYLIKNPFLKFYKVLLLLVKTLVKQVLTFAFRISFSIKSLFFFHDLLVCIFNNTALAQFRFDSWTTDNGLPQSSINSILQTRDGFLWFTTFGGLVRYDGLRFQVFNAGNTKGLTTSRFLGLFEDREGSLGFQRKDEV